MARPAAGAGRQAEIAGLLLGLALAGGGCANVADPPGGPPDTKPPAVVSVRPESGAVVPNLRGDAVIQFDEVIDEMGGAGGGGAPGTVSGLARQVVLSPVAGNVKVSWHRSSIHVKPAEGWKPRRVYRLELLPGILDLRRNIQKQGRTVIFSTGPELPHAALAGTALQWVEQRALPQAVVRAALLPDTVAYVTVADSAGEFRLTNIPPGRYLVYAIQDQNNNRQRDRREPFDSAIVTLDSTAAVVLWTFVHDTAGPRLRAAEPLDSLAFRLVFSQALDPAPLDTARVRLYALPDTTPVPVRAVLAPAQYDSLEARARAAADSLRRAGKPEGPAGAQAPAPAAQRAPAVAGAQGARTDTAKGAVAPGAAGARRAAAKGAGAPPADTSRIRRLLKQRPAPFDRLVVRTGQPLVPGAKYLIRVRGATNLNGAAADGQAVLTIPVPKPAIAPRAPGDTARTPRDSTRPP